MAELDGVGQLSIKHIIFVFLTHSLQIGLCEKKHFATTCTGHGIVIHIFVFGSGGLCSRPKGFSLYISENNTELKFSRRLKNGVPYFPDISIYFQKLKYFKSVLKEHRLQ